jgi:ankyrin repeat protein
VPDVADAAQRKDLAALRTLVTKRADINTPQADGTTALHWAVHWNEVEAAKLLLRAGANPATKNRFGASPLSEAAFRRERRTGEGAARCRSRCQRADHGRRRDRADDRGAHG